MTTHNGVHNLMALPTLEHPNGTGTLELCLTVSEPDVYSELTKRKEPDRSEFALAAMRVGVIAIRQAQGQVDAHQIRDAGESVIRNMTDALEAHRRDTAQQIEGCIREYFDPQGGLFTQRVKGLVGSGDEAGELERIIRQQVEGEGSQLARTLAAHLGESSPLMNVLSPDSQEGLVTQLARATEATLSEQRSRILAEFSLDNQGSALTRLVSELQRNHGDVGRALEERIGSVMGEFSLDKQDSALSRLVSQVESAHRRLSNEFSLDNDNSALARLRKELLATIEQERASNTEFRLEVLKTLTDMTARKQEAQRSTRHGMEFEDAVFEFINRRQGDGNTAARTGNTTGRIRYSKKGDAVLQLGPESAAPGARIVIEAKQDQSYTLQKALGEIEEARRNRDAGVGLFVFSRRTVPSEITEPLLRFGNDLVAVWDADDPVTKVYLVAALSVAKALSVRGEADGETAGVNVEALDKAVREVERQAGGLDEITKSAQAIDGHVTKILDRARIVRNGLDRQVGLLDEKVGGLRKLSLSP